MEQSLSNPLNQLLGMENAASAFAEQTGLTPEKRMGFMVIQLVIMAGYVLFLHRTLPMPQKEE